MAPAERVGVLTRPFVRHFHKNGVTATNLRKIQLTFLRSSLLVVNKACLKDLAAATNYCDLSHKMSKRKRNWEEHLYSQLFTPWLLIVDSWQETPFFRRGEEFQPLKQVVGKNKRGTSGKNLPTGIRMTIRLLNEPTESESQFHAKDGTYL